MRGKPAWDAVGQEEIDVLLFEQAQGSKLPIQRLADRVVSVFTPIVLAIAAITFFVWLALGPAPAITLALVSTVAVLVAYDRHYAVLWAGDSRVYRLRAGTLERLTHDHSLVQELVDEGSISPAEAESHPMRNRITRAVGLPDPLELDRAQGELAGGDLFLLCTDGLTGLVDEATTQRLLGTDAADLGAAPLIQAALDAGGTDNVTVVLVQAEDREKTWPGAAAWS